MSARAVVAQTRMEVVLTLRRSESLLLTLGIPVALLAFFSTVEVLPTDAVADRPVDFLAPGVLALATMSTAMVGLGIATGFERHSLVLKRLGATPLGRGGLLVAKTASVLAVQAIQVVVLGAEALVLGWRPTAGGAVIAAGAMLVGTVAFAAIGFLLAGTLRAEVNLAAANGLWLVLLLLGGIVVPLAELPVALRTLAQALPAAALSDVLHGALNDSVSVPARAWVVLAAWAAAAPPVAARAFRWE